MISSRNRALIERMFRRPPPTSDPALKVTLTMGGLEKMLDAARAEGMADAMAAGVSRSKTATENIEAVLEAVSERLRNGR